MADHYALVQALTGSLFINCVVVLLALYFLTGIRSYWRLRKIPGPRLNAWSNWPLCATHFRGRLLTDFFELTQEYGPLVRVSPNTLICSDPDVLRRMSDRKSPYTRDEFYVTGRLVPGEDNIFSEINEELHSAKRKRMLAGYAGKENELLEQDIDDCVRDLVHLIEERYVSVPPEKVTPMDLARKIQYFTTDVISRIAMDNKFHDLRDDNDNYGYIQEAESVVPNIASTQAFPNVLQFLTDIGLLKLLAPDFGSTSTLGLGKIMSITRNKIRERFDEEGNPKDPDEFPDMLGSFMRHGLTQKDLEGEAMVQMIAGSDTTASGLRATLLAVFSNPRVHSKLLAEIQQAVVNGNFGSEKDTVVSDEQARQLPYLQACINEGLRWYPPIAALLTKKVPPEGDKICGYSIPGGTGIAYSAQAVHRNQSLFGPDEDLFRPERWITKENGGDERSADKIKAMEDNNELIFGYGKYQCLGKSIAFVSLRSTIDPRPNC